LLVNKRNFGGRVEEFLDIPKSYKQVIIDDKGNIQKYQWIETGVPSRYRTEKKITRYLKQLEEKLFKNKLLLVSDEEIKEFGKYVEVDYIGLTKSLKEKSSAMLETPKGIYYFSLEEGKELNDAFIIMFKPLPYTAGML